MTLDDWMAQNGVTCTDFGAELGVAHTTVVRWRRRLIEPRGEMIERVVRATRGAVTPAELAPRAAAHWRAAEAIAARYTARASLKPKGASESVDLDGEVTQADKPR